MFILILMWESKMSYLVLILVRFPPPPRPKIVLLEFTGLGWWPLLLLPIGVMTSLADRSSSPCLWYQIIFLYLMKKWSYGRSKVIWSDTVWLNLLNWVHMLGKKQWNPDYKRVVLEGRWLLQNLEFLAFKSRNERVNKTLSSRINSGQFSVNLYMQKIRWAED